MIVATWRSSLFDLLTACAPAGGIVADFFAGIASGGLAARAEACSWIGAECDPQWWSLAEARIAAALDQPHPSVAPSLFTDGAA
jgi:hypothetical protein